MRRIAYAVLAMVLAVVMLALPAGANAGEAPAPEATTTTPEATTMAPESGATPDAIAKTAADAEYEALGGLPFMGNDYVWFGRDLELSKSTIGNDLIAAGQVANISDVKAGGSLRVAGQDVTINNSTAGQNATIAGQTVTLNNVSANAVALAGATVSVSGTCQGLSIYGGKVFIDGTVNGDVNVGAQTVEIGSNARIKGTLHVSAESEPVMQRGAEVADVDFTKQESTSDSASPVDTSGIEAVGAGIGGALTVISVIVGIVSTFIISLLAEWLFRRHTAAAAEMIRTRTGAHIGTGIIGAIVAPIACILLLFLVVTIPIVIGVALALAAMAVVASGFAGASLSKLVFSKLGRYKSAMLGGLIFGVVGAIPILGGIVGVAAFMYLLGYVLQSIYLSQRSNA